MIGKFGVVNNKDSSLSGDEEGLCIESSGIWVNLRDLSVLDLLYSIELDFDWFAHGVYLVAVVHLMWELLGIILRFMFTDFIHYRYR